MHLRASTILLITSLMGISTAWAQSLADVARQEEARRKTIEGRGKVYTNKDLNEVPAPATPAADTAATAATPDTSKDVKNATADKEKAKDNDTNDTVADKGKDTPKDQTYWSGRMKALQVTLERDQVYADALQTRISALSTDFVNRDDPAQRALVAADRNKAVAELERLKQAILDDKKAISDLEEEARRGNVPPGWLR